LSHPEKSSHSLAPSGSSRAFRHQLADIKPLKPNLFLTKPHKRALSFLGQSKAQYDLQADTALLSIMPHYRQQKLLKALTFVLGEMGLGKCMSPFGFDLPMRPPWHMRAYAQLDTRINRTNILFTAWGWDAAARAPGGSLSFIRNSQAKPQVEDPSSKEGPQHWPCLKPK